MFNEVPNYKLVETTFEQRLKELGLHPTPTNQGVLTGYPGLELYRSNMEIGSMEVKGEKSYSASLEVKAVVRLPMFGHIEMLDLITLKESSLNRAIEKCAHTYMDVSFPAIQRLFETGSVTKGMIFPLTAYLPVLQEMIHWELYTGDVQILDDESGSLTKLLNGEQPFQFMPDTIGHFLTDLRIHWFKLFGTHSPTLGLHFGCSLDGMKFNQAENELHRNFQPRNPSGNWEFRQFVVLKPILTPEQLEKLLSLRDKAIAEQQALQKAREATQQSLEPFLNAIRSQPNEDLPRLELANSLLEKGDEAQATLIRTQIERKHLPLDDSRQSELQAQELVLLADHSAHWVAGPPILGSGRFRRGMVEFISSPAPYFLEQAEEVSKLAPLREVRLTHLGAGEKLGARLAQWEGWSDIDGLFLDDMLGYPATEETLLDLFASPYLRQIRKLTLFCGANTPEVFRKILATPALQELNELYINGGLTSDQVLEILNEFRQLPITKIRLHKGWYHQAAMTNEVGLGHLAASRHWRRLTELNVGIAPDPSFLPTFADGLPHSQLRVLRLHNFMWKGAYGMREFAQAPSWGNLRELSLYYFELSSEELDELLSSPHLGQLTRLTLFGATLKPSDLEKIAKCSNLSGLRTLDLSANWTLGPEGGEILRSATSLSNVVDLKMIWTQVADVGAVAIAQSSHFSKLRNLELANNFVTAKGIQSLAESPYLKQLVRLRLFENPTGPWQRLLPTNAPLDTFRINRETILSLTSGNLPHLSCVEMHGFEFPDGCIQPLLDSPTLKWFTAQAEQISSATEREAFLGRTQRNGWMPPLDEFQEEEEPFV